MGLCRRRVYAHKSSHVEAIKYTCPRCGVHTCSLPCVKKHKARAQCSGVRNPAEYRKRSELATAASIDKDFNFITNVERTLARADDNVLDRGISLAPARTIRAGVQLPKVVAEIEERGIKVIRAPKGLSRSKSNKTSWNGARKCIQWTVEWVSPDGSKQLGSASEDKPVGESYVHLVGKNSIKQKRKLSQSHAAQKSMKATKAATPSNGSVAEKIESEAVAQEPKKEDVLAGLYFYLHYPATSSKLKCLQPLNRDQLLRTAVEGQTLLEFPTIYVRLEESVNQMPDNFISKVEYDQRHGADIPISVTAPLEEGEVEESTSLGLPNTVDVQKVLHSLAQDLGG